MAPRWPLRRRLVALVLLLLAAAATVIGVVSTLALRSSLVAQLDDQLAAAADRGSRPHAVPPDLDGDEPLALAIPGQSEGTVWVEFVARGSIVTRTAGYIDDYTVRTLTGAQLQQLVDVPADGRARTMTIAGLDRYRVLARSGTSSFTVVGLPMSEVDRTTARHILTTGVVTAVGLLVIGLLGTFLVRRELRPLERVAATATRVAQLPLHRGEVALPDRVPDADTDQRTEVGKVGAALNQLLGHVEDALGARQASETKLRQFVADASHELRTPLASIRGYAELVRRVPDEVPPDVLRAMGRVESEAVRMTTLVEDLLLLARLDSGRALDRAPVDLSALAADAVGDAHAAGQDHVWRLALPGDEDEPAEATVLGDEHALRQVLANLLSNARVHTPAGTTVTTTVSTGPDAVVLTVRDDGPGIDPELQGRLFDRFARGDAARSPGTGSTGLGLAIAHAVVRAHHGQIDVDGAPGATTFTVTFPTAQASQPEAVPEEPEEPAESAESDAPPRPPFPPPPPPPPFPTTPPPPPAT